MNRFNRALFLCTLTIPLSACKTLSITNYYVTPALTGQLLDKETQQPITNVSVYLTDEFQTNSDSLGRFNLPAMVVSDDMSGRRDIDDLYRIYKYADLMIEADRYQRKLFNIDGISQPIQDFDIHKPASVDMGKIYLEPLEEGEHVYDRVYQYVQTVPPCKFTQIQKEVDCIPVAEEE